MHPVAVNTVHMIVARRAKRVPPPPEPDDTRSKLLREARDAYLDVGPAAFSLREVARRVGISAPGVYRHFDSKAALLSAVCEQGFQVFASYLMRALAEPTPAQRIRATADQYVRFGLENPRDYRFIFMSALDEVLGPAEARAKAEDRGSTFRFLVDRVRECADAGLVAPGDPEQTAVFIWSHVHGLVSLRLAGHLKDVGSDEAFHSFFMAASDRLLAGLATSPRARSTR